jgi:plastocyanin
MRTTLRNALIAAALGAATAPLLAAIVLPAGAQNAPVAVGIDNFTFNPQTLTVKANATVTWTTRTTSRTPSPR